MAALYSAGEAASEVGVLAVLKVKLDAVAARGIVKRQGLGPVRYLAVGDLWVQQRAKNKEVACEKLPGAKNTSDMMTKAVEQEIISRHMQALHVRFRPGRHEATPLYNGSEDGTPGE